MSLVRCERVVGFVISNETFEEEQKRLEATQALIRSQMDQCMEDLDERRKTEIDLNRQMWEETGSSITDMVGVADFWSFQGMINNNKRLNTQTRQLLDRLSRSYLAPYFGRFDFLEEAGAPESVYVGVGSVVDEETHEYWAYDWRAPICSIFYDYELGQASYTCPAGEIKGNVSLKRQYTLEDGRLTGMFESGVKIDDDILQHLLSRNVDEGMRTIVTSIQREQNRIIRHRDVRAMAVYGPAGSGKTSVALHRIAYLLYHNRDTLNAAHVLIMSPNYLFGQYIAGVLPELGEENIRRLPFAAFAAARLASMLQGTDEHGEPRVEVQTFPEQVEELLQRGGKDPKAEPAFVTRLQQYAAAIKQRGSAFEDVVWEGQVLLTARELQQLYEKDYAYLPPLKRLGKIRNRVEYLLQPIMDRTRQELKAQYEREAEQYTGSEIVQMVHRDMEQRFHGFKQKLGRMVAPTPLALYRGFLEHEKLPFSYKGAAEGRRGYLSLADASGLLYLAAVLGGLDVDTRIRQVVLDECQDYSALQLQALYILFPAASFTLAGDFNQSLYPGEREREPQVSPQDYPLLTLQLTKSYRSTRAIMRLAHCFIGDEGQYEFVRRQGEKPRLLSAGDHDELVGYMGDFIQNCAEDRLPFAAIITRTARTAEHLHTLLADRCPGLALARDSESFKRGAVVIPIALAKGLEFDAVLVAPDILEAAEDEGGKRLLYTACTRALHRLWITGLPLPEWALACERALQDNGGDAQGNAE